MDKRVKFSIKQKVSVVESILSGRQTIRGAARELGCHKSGVQRWLEQYRQHGRQGFKLRNGGYVGRFKVKVVEYYLKNGLSLKQTASYFKIPGEGIIGNWIKIYERLGAEGLLKETRGRKRSIMARKPKKKEMISNDPVAQKLAQMQEELEYLRAENAFLKKLSALVQQEEAAKAQARRPKSSGN
jgi:transposase